MFDFTIQFDASKLVYFNLYICMFLIDIIIMVSQLLVKQYIFHTGYSSLSNNSTGAFAFTEAKNGPKCAYLRGSVLSLFV